MKRKEEAPGRKPDPELAGARPTAASPEFVPKTVISPETGFTAATDAEFDFIPHLKKNRFE